MHYHYEIFLKPLSPKPNILEVLTAAMAPFDENVARHPHGFWDWYQVGGRWRGVHLGLGTLPDLSKNKLCAYCDSTGIREWEGQKRACNVCRGNRFEEAWPTEWTLHPADILRLDNPIAQQVLQDPKQVFGCIPHIIMFEELEPEERTTPEYLGYWPLVRSWRAGNGKSWIGKYYAKAILREPERWYVVTVDTHS